MESEVIACPSCQHEVRVPESLFGQPVRCPSCKAYFVAPTREADGRLGRAELMSEAPVRASSRVRAQDRDNEETEPRDKPSLVLPATFLLFVGVLGTVVNGVTAYTWNTNTEQMKRQFDKLRDDNPNLFGQGDPKQVKLVLDLMPLVTVLIFAVSTVPFFGALAMFTQRFWWLALAGSFVAMFNIGNACCCIGLPTGIYCAIRLFSPDVKRLFMRT